MKAHVPHCWLSGMSEIKHKGYVIKTIQIRKKCMLADENHTQKDKMGKAHGGINITEIKPKNTNSKSVGGWLHSVV